MVNNLTSSDVLKLDSKNIDLDQINNFIHGGSLFSAPKVLTISNYFSISKPVLTKLSPLLTKSELEVYLWQDKLLNATQLKMFPLAKIKIFKANNELFRCLNALKPGNLKIFINLYEKVISQEIFDLFYYLLKSSFRRQLQNRSVYSQKQLLKTYLQLVELEYQYKTGQLSMDRTLALKRVLIPLLK